MERIKQGVFMKLYLEGKTDAQIAHILHRPLPDIYSFRFSLNLPTNYKSFEETGKKHLVSMTEFIVLHEMGLDDEQMAKELAISAENVRRRRVKMGLPEIKAWKKMRSTTPGVKPGPKPVIVDKYLETKKHRIQKEREAAQKQMLALGEQRKQERRYLQDSTVTADKPTPWLDDKGKWRTQICWYCRKAAGGFECPWADKGKPVEGWEAVKNRFYIYNARQITSYRITKCPLFEPDPPREDYVMKWLQKAGFEVSEDETD